ncbi:hypothetical protein Btru_001616 [Bulinus truncatus]|nr:hypothetical protein Btru_001616 [Bulinus truncatus]
MHKHIGLNEKETKGRLLRSIDAIRILSAYNEAVRRAEIVTALPYIIENISVLRFSFGSELIEAVERHCRIQSAYQETRSRLDHLTRAKERVLDRIHMLKANAEEQSRTMFPGTADQRSLFDFYDPANAEEELGKGGSGVELGADDVHESYLAIKGPQSFVPIKERSSYEASNTESEAVVEDSTAGDDLDIALSELTEPTLLNSDSMRSSKVNDEQRHTKISYRSVETLTKTSVLDLELTLSIYEPQIEELIHQLAQISRKVVHSLKNVLRLFTTNPMALKSLGKHAIARHHRSVGLLELMRELGGILKARLLVTPEEEKSNLEYLDTIYKREERTRKYLAMLEAELEMAKSEMDGEFQTKLQVIENLKTDIKQIEAFSNENIRRTLGNAEKIEFNCNKNSEQRTKLVNDDITGLETKLDDICRQHREEEGYLRTEKYKVESELESLIKRYDADMGSKMDEFERLEIIYEDERKILADTEDKFAELEKEYTDLMEERLLARRRQEWTERESKRYLRQVVTIQSYWRSYVVRKTIVKEMKRMAKEAKKREKLLKAQEKMRQATE